MPTIITTPKAVEQSTIVFTLNFYDEDENALTPESLTHTLTDLSGTVIDELNQVALTPAAEVTLVYTGTSLTLAQGVGRKRLVTIRGMYDSGAGTSLSFIDTIEFEIIDAVVVT